MFWKVVTLVTFEICAEQFFGLGPPLVKGDLPVLGQVLQHFFGSDKVPGKGNRGYSW